MNKYVKIMGVMALGLLVANCSGTNYKIKTEKSKVLNEVPKWYVNDFSKKKACNTPRFGKDKNKMCIFGVSTAVSPDLQLAIEKGMMVAKSELADKVKGEMNKSSKIYITELGKNHNKTTVSEVESTIVNLIKNLIIISLVVVIVTGMSGAEFLDYIASGLDKLQELVYTIKSEVNI